MILTLTGLVLTSCNKVVEVSPPPNQIINSTVFNDDATAMSALLGIYSTMMQNQGLASMNVTFFTGLSSDELTNYSTDASLAELFNNTLTISNNNVKSLWGDAYHYIYEANALIEGVNTATNISSITKQEITGESKFIRAFCYFYLVNLYGDVPLIISTDLKGATKATRSPKLAVYQQIIADLKDAQNLLSNNFLKIDNTPYPIASSERVRPTKWAASALLARAYLYTGDWVNAANQASSVVGNTSMFHLVTTGLNQVFLKNSSEAIWQLMPVYPGFNTFEAATFILSAEPSGLQGVALNNKLVNSFEPGDFRKDAWIGQITTGSNTYYYAYKYKTFSSSITEYYMVLRLAEQYLIRAEAEANGAAGGTNAAISDLNVIRNRAGLPNYNGMTDQTSVLNAIYHERQIELLAEWGHRWFDLKRLGMTDAVLGSNKSGWKPTAALYPIPLYEIQNDPNLSQNNGY